MASSSATACIVTNEAVHHYNNMTDTGSNPLLFERPVPKSQKTVEPKTCFDILNEYTEYRLKLGKSKKKNICQDHDIIRMILNFMDFLDLNELDRSGAEKIAKAYCYRPKNPQKYPELEGLQGFDLIAKNESLRKKKKYISLETAKGHIQKMSTFMAWAKSHGYVSDNVFYKLPMKKSTQVKTVFPFTEEHLFSIFSMSDYAKHKYLHPFYYWIPMLLRYTGARMNEICQLVYSDIVIADGIYCLIIRDALEDQSVKTGKTRLIPIHNELLKKGFIEFVNSKESGRLFPELSFANGYYSPMVSKWFARRRKALGIDSKYNGYSFRRSFINELKQKLVSKDIVESIAGHEHGERLNALSNELVNSVVGLPHNSESFDTYSYQYSPKILAPAVNMIDTSHTENVLPYFSFLNY